MDVRCGIMDQCDTNIDFIIVCRSVTYISCSSDFVYYFEDYVGDECHIWDNGLM